jgi:mRNA interferase RelE/StbE
VPDEPYEVAWTPTGKRDLSKLPEKVATAVIEFVYGSLSDNPQRLGHALHLELLGMHSARRGDYRVIYRIDETQLVIHIAAIDHRSDVYRRRQAQG